MRLVALDLEMNQAPGNPDNIIQIGVAAGDTATGEILARASWFVNPQEKLTDMIVNLTGITQEQVDSGLTLPEAYQKLCEFHKAYSDHRNFVTWGQGDCGLIKKQLGLDGNQFVGGRREIDAKTLYVSWRIANCQGYQSGLAKSLLKMGLRFEEGRKHNAEADAVNTFRIFHALLGKMKA